MYEFILKSEIIALGLVSIAMLYSIFVRPYLVKNNKLTSDQLALIDFACKKGVDYAEQLYKNDLTIDRSALAIDYAFDVVEQAGVIPENYLFIIEGMIESAVLKLPPTHSFK